MHLYALACIIVCKLAIGDTRSAYYWMYIPARHSYIWYPLPNILFLFNRLRIFRAIAHIVPARPHLYFISHSRSMPLRYRESSSTGAREHACRCLYLHAALVLEQPNHDSLHLEASPGLWFDEWIRGLRKVPLWRQMWPRIFTPQRSMHPCVNQVFLVSDDNSL